MQLLRPFIRPAARVALFAGLLALLIAGARLAAANANQTGRALVPLTIGRAAFSATPLGSFRQVTAITHAGDDRLFVAERDGRVKIVHPDGRATVFLDIRHRVLSGRGEFGFYDLAFHPGYADPASPGYGFFYVSFTSGVYGQSVNLLVSRFRVTANPDAADPASEVLLLVEPQTSQMHKGGALDFDPRDNRLYVGVGDDFKNVIAQDGVAIKGKLVRLAVDQVPRDATAGHQAVIEPQIWAAGLRNPWRIDVDPIGNQILIGDVGDSHWEEINLAPLTTAGTNFGWPCMEGPLVKPDYATQVACQNPQRFQRAIHEYSHRDGAGRCAVIGGRVNRPSHNPGDGRYTFSDLCTGEIFALTRQSTGAWQRALLGALPQGPVATIGEDRHGTQYVGIGADDAPIYRLYIP
jgi:glucose/arabinose dehydrogenase